MNFYEVLEKRVSTRKYTDEKVRDADIKKQIDAAYKAPIGLGAYDNCRLTVIKDKSLIEEISKEYMDKLDKKSAPLFNAPLLIIFSSDNKENDLRFQDAGCLLENISLAATSLDLGSCYIRGVFHNLGDEGKYIEKLNLDEGFYPVSGIVIGHPEAKLVGKEHTIKTDII